MNCVYDVLYSLSALRKKTENCGNGWPTENEKRKRERGGGRRHGSMMSIRHQGFISQIALQLNSETFFTGLFHFSPSLFSFLFSPARVLFLSVILARVTASIRNLGCSVKQTTKPAAWFHLNIERSTGHLTFWIKEERSLPIGECGVILGNFFYMRIN